MKNKPATKDILETLRLICLTLENENRPNIPSLLRGKAGICLFYAYYYLHTMNNDDLEKCIMQLESCIQIANENRASTGFGEGYAGIAWLIVHLINIGVVDEESISIIDDIDLLIDRTLQFDIEAGDYDLFYGYIGKGLYFLEAAAFFDKASSIELIYQALERQARSHFRNGPYWIDEDCKDKETVNLGLAHGVPGILLFCHKLSGYLTPGVANELCLKGIDWLSTFSNPTPSVYQFPQGVEIIDNEIDPDRIDYTNRLAWCYGDLGIAFSFLKLGKAMGNNTIIDKAMQILEICTTRSVKESGIALLSDYNCLDTCLCHGTSGVAYIYKQLYTLTGKELFREQHYFWLNHTINNAGLLIENSRSRGFKAELINEQFCIVEDVSFLNGIAGVGLTLLAEINPRQTGWEKILLLDL